MLTAAVRDLHAYHGDEFSIQVETNHAELWYNNPHLSRFNIKDRDVWYIPCHYPLIHSSNEVLYHFQHGYVKYLEEKLNISIPITKSGGDIHLSEDEKQIPKELPPNYWVINGGGKMDFTCKWWPHHYYQEVVDHFKGHIPFVQIGKSDHHHPKLSNVIDRVGQTNLRDLIKLIYHSAGVLTPVSLPMHLAAAMPPIKPCIVVAGGREPVTWEAYNGHQFLHTVGQLKCCDNGGCWKSRVVPIDKPERKSLCSLPVKTDTGDYAKCMTMITPDQVILHMQRYLEKWN